MFYTFDRTSDWFRGTGEEFRKEGQGRVWHGILKSLVPNLGKWKRGTLSRNVCTVNRVISYTSLNHVHVYL